MYSASDLKKGLKIEIDGAPWVITEFDFCKPGKGTALYRCRMKNMITGVGMEHTYRPTDKIDQPNIEEREMYYSYFDGQNYNGYDWYFNYTTDTQAAVDVYLETVEDVEGGLRLYFDNNGVKTYIVAFPRDGDTTKGTLKFDTAVPTEYWRYNTEYNTLVYTSVTGEQFHPPMIISY